MLPPTVNVHLNILTVHWRAPQLLVDILAIDELALVLSRSSS